MQQEGGETPHTKHKGTLRHTQPAGTACTFLLPHTWEAASISKTNRREAGTAEVFLTVQNLSGYKEMELPT